MNAAPTDLTGKVCLVTRASGGISACAAAFFESDQSSYITAQTIGVDGGNVLR